VHASFCHFMCLCVCVSFHNDVCVCKCVYVYMYARVARCQLNTHIYSVSTAYLQRIYSALWRDDPPDGDESECPQLEHLCAVVHHNSTSRWIST
jgi:hypothetical protein